MWSTHSLATHYYLRIQPLTLPYAIWMESVRATAAAVDTCSA